MEVIRSRRKVNDRRVDSLNPAAVIIGDAARLALASTCLTDIRIHHFPMKETRHELDEWSRPGHGSAFGGPASHFGDAI
jgi:hypothetical protein